MKHHGRKLLAEVQGYTPGEQPRDGAYIKLNTNENPYPPSPKVIDALRALDAGALRKYPDPMSMALREACAQRYGMPNADWVIVGNGMDELLAMAVRAFLDPGDNALTVYPTYSLYEVLCGIHGCQLQYEQLDDSFLPPASFFGHKARLCFLARPNAPTGVAMPREEVARFCATFDGVVLIDEAYVDFADDTCMDFPARFDNVMVTRTFSKSFSLAGMRIGVAAAQPELINELLKIKDSYNLNTFSQAAGLAAIEDYDYMLAQAARVCVTRERMREALMAMGFDVPKSQSNFLLAYHQGAPTAVELFQALRERHILVRYFAQPRLDNALRITVGTEDEADALLEALADLVGYSR